MKDKVLREAGLKVTAPRLLILQLLEEQHNHLSAEEIHQQLQQAGHEVGAATVYRALLQFEQAGLVTRHNFEGDRCVFELERGEHHDHLVCVQCGRVEEFVDEIIEARQAHIAKTHQFELTDHTLVIYGKCQACNEISGLADSS